MDCMFKQPEFEQYKATIEWTMNILCAHMPNKIAVCLPDV